jgi:predicted amidohydrolase YtcJ
MSRMMRTFLASMGVIVFCVAALAQRTVTVPESVVAYPSMIVYNGKVVTMDDTSFGLNTQIGRIVQAMAVRDGKIMAVGTNDEIVAMAGPQTDKIDLKGRMVMPGIVDTHTHIHNNELNSWVGKHPEAVAAVSTSYSVSGKTDLELTNAITAAVKEHVAKAEPGRWAFIQVGSGPGNGTGAGVSFLALKKYTKDMLNKIAPSHPIMLVAHPSYVINSAGIEGIKKLYGSAFSEDAAGIDEAGRVRATAPQYGRGLVVDEYFNTRVPELAQIVEDGLAKNAGVGITTFVSHIMGQRFLDAFNYLARRDRMPIRFGYTHWFGFAAGYPDPANFYRRVGDMAGMGTDYFWMNAVGLGSIDSGPPRFCSTMEASKAQKDLEWCQNAEGSTMFEAVRVATANYERVQVGHAYADKGVDYFMDAVEAGMKDNPAITLEYVKSLRLSSDHCGFYPSVEQLPRMAKLGMMISCAGGVLTRSYPWIGPGRYAPQYVKRIAPIASAIKAGVMPTVEDEAGVSGLSAHTYFHDATPFLTRKNELGADVSPEEAVDRNTLIKMMTSWPARYVMKEKVLGTLEKGKLADFLVLSGDYFTTPTEKLGDIIPLMTVVGGKVIVMRDEFAKELGRSAVGPQIAFDNKARYAAPAE